MSCCSKAARVLSNVLRLELVLSWDSATRFLGRMIQMSWVAMSLLPWHSPVWACSTFEKNLLNTCHLQHPGPSHTQTPSPRALQSLLFTAHSPLSDQHCGQGTVFSSGHLGERFASTRFCAERKSPQEHLILKNKIEIFFVDVPCAGP